MLEFDREEELTREIMRNKAIKDKEKVCQLVRTCFAVPLILYSIDITGRFEKAKDRKRATKTSIEIKRGFDLSDAQASRIC